VSYYPGDMVRLTEGSAAYATGELESERRQGIVIKSRKREVHREKGSLGLMTELAVIDMVEIMWSDGSIEKLNGRYLEKITPRMIHQEGVDDG